jgi:antitoxin VapB
MHSVFYTKQFRAGNSQAVRLPAKLAYPPETELTLTRIGEKIVIEPTAETLDGFVNFLCSVGRQHDGQRVELDVPARDWQ